MQPSDSRAIPPFMVSCSTKGGNRWFLEGIENPEAGDDMLLIWRCIAESLPLR
jgi:hypothetical protein